MVVAVLVHLDRKEVIPLAIAPIVRQDGETKNDCERNTPKRLLARIKQQHAKLKLTVTKDGLSRNSPHINDLRSYGFKFEHNYGHGKQNLSTVLATLMMLAFLVDQTRQAYCPLFQAVLEQVAVAAVGGNRYASRQVAVFGISEQPRQESPLGRLRHHSFQKLTQTIQMPLEYLPTNQSSHHHRNECHDSLDPSFFSSTYFFYGLCGINPYFVMGTTAWYKTT